MAKRRTDIYYDANRLILRVFKGNNLLKLANLYAVTDEQERATLKQELSRIERTLAHKYGVQLDTVKSQTGEIIRQLRTALR